MNAKNAKIAIGTSGWSYPDWKGVVFPLKTRGGFDSLKYLTQYIDTIEINSSFYAIPRKQVVKGWYESVKDVLSFTFSAKLPREFTHIREKSLVDRLLDEFVDSFSPLIESGKLTTVLAQFPWSFKFSTQNLNWLRYISEALTSKVNIRLAIEVRHNSWLRSEYIEFLQANGLIFCNIDQPALTDNIPPTDIITTDVSYIRLHSRNKDKWFEFVSNPMDRYDYLYSFRELDEWKNIIEKMSPKVSKIYVYFNNHPKGKGFVNTLMLKKLLGYQVKSPPVLPARFPLAESALEIIVDENRQGWLF